MCAVEWKKLGDLGTFENIGVDKKIVQGEVFVTLLNYVDVYKNKYITEDIPTMRVTAPLKKVTACNVLKGDIFITPTSETKDDIGHTAVALDTLDNVVYSYHLMRYRLSQFNMINSYYINYIFDTFTVKEQIYKFANGLTRFGLSKDKFADIIIPYPSLAKQQEIVSHLDTFTTLISNLESELDMRRKQYEHYRNQLLDFEGVEIKTLNEIADIVVGFPFDSSRFVDKGTRLMRGMNIKRGYLDFDDSLNKYWNTTDGLQKYELKANDIVISMDGSLVGRSFAIIEQKHLPLLLVQRVARIRSNYNIKFIYYNICMFFSDYVDKKKTAGAIPHISMKDIQNFSIPFPSSEAQQEIVEKLDAFENLIQSLDQEIKLREKQYEYYREKLLTFEKE